MWETGPSPTPGYFKQDLVWKSKPNRITNKNYTSMKSPEILATESAVHFFASLYVCDLEILESSVQRSYLRHFCYNFIY